MAQFLQGQQQAVDTSPVRVKAQRGFKARINGESRATSVMPGSIVEVPFNVACNLRAAQKAHSVDPKTPLVLVTDYRIPDRIRSNASGGEIAELRRQVAALTAKVEGRPVASKA